MKKNTINIILANAPVKSHNKGCVALSISSLKILRDVFIKKGIEAMIYLPDSGIKEDGIQTYHIEDIEDLEYISCRNLPYNLGSLTKILLNPKSFFRSIMIFYKSDFIFDIGQGDSFSDIYGEKRFSLIDKIHRFARLFHKPYCFLPQTIGPFSDDSIKKKAVKSINSALLVMVRDDQSLKYVEEISSSQIKVRNSIDVAFMLPYKETSFDGRYTHVGLNVSALLWHGGYKRNNQFGLKDDYQTVVRNIIQFFLDQERVKLHLVPHVVSDEREFENDYAVCYDLLREFKSSNLLLSPFFMGPCEAKNYISGLDFFMGARMHATIAAFSSGVPVVPMAYSRKFNGLFEETLQYSNVVDLKTMSKNEIMNTISVAFEKRNMIKTLIAERMKGIVYERKRLLYSDLIEFMKL